ncbi:MAG: NeuD/PglB/VioB family sugar acetyltransferase [Pseudomonadota bacterium]|nr:NeuD/PglB/VioB family sugar acetyltransferase [Pseudomonadota bacterium]
MQAREILIFPRNGNGVEALACLGTAWRMVGFIHDAPEQQGVDAYGHPVFARSALDGFPAASVLAVPGSATSFRSRRQVIEGLGLATARFATVIHPAAQVSPLARLGRNVLIMAGAVITSNAVIGDHVCILPNSVVHHDATVGDWSLIGANVTVAGGTRIGENCYVGSGSSIMNGLHLGDGCLIGLGSCVIRDVAPGTTVAGNPARELRQRASAPDAPA